MRIRSAFGPAVTAAALVGAALVSVAVADDDETLPPPREEYKGRRIAQTMHWTGAEWLLRETREDEENPAKLLAWLDLEPGQTVCDLGCGNGYHALRIAKIVGPKGRVIGVDIQKEMLTLLAERAKAAGVDNVEPVLGGVADPNLEAGSCDVILMVDVYHELSYPERILKRIREALEPRGRLVLVEFRAEDPEVPIKKLHKMSKAQILKELVPNGFRLDGELDDLPWQHAMAFVRDDAPAD